MDPSLPPPPPPCVRGERRGRKGRRRRRVKADSSRAVELKASNVGRYKLARVGNGANTDRVEYGRIERDRGRRKKKGLELKGLTNTAASLLFFFLDNFFVALPRFYLSNCSVLDAILTLPLPPPNSFHRGFVRFTSNNARRKMFEESQGGGRLSNRG